jgi:hypothetical protein
VLDAPEARSVLEEVAPDLLESAMLQQLAEFPLRSLMKLALGEDDPRIDIIVERVKKIKDPRPAEAEEPPAFPDKEYEAATVQRGSAQIELPSDVRRYIPCEVLLKGPSHGNPFVDVEVSAKFQHEDETVTVGGFYDGEGRYIIRFLPATPGHWQFTTSSTARSLDGITGTFEVYESEQRGPVRVVDNYHFEYSDGTPYLPVGTTAYAWTHQDQSQEEATLKTLTEAPFNKLRMCLFPKDFLYNSNDPDKYVWLREADGTWDTTRFDVTYWRHLEQRIRDLGELGIEADLIIFHPYDKRWAHSHQSRAADDRYVRYMVRRLSAFPNVWWSLANEYDLLLNKRVEDWDRLAGLIQDEDHVGHLLSIHNWVEIWDYSSSWATHCSIQHGEQLAKNVDSWRRRWKKPVLVDEAGYEGDLDQGWGNLTAEDMVRRFWEITLRGGYATHGETFYRADEAIWWSKGGELIGESLSRIRFLKSLTAESPTTRIDPLPSDFDAIWAGVTNQYCLIYFGDHRPAFRNVVIPPGMKAEIDVIDTWNMTIEPQPGAHQGEARVELPARPYMAIRLRAV